ncbi:uncharacterized protein LOC108682092 [Hyalella azteca]|uniref:Uncharacterized protein LOC108682092 n=1 Tax=Hyalella azteca TaxID=294128 RepID=A0A8B7PMU8_HYAAZ|nr:uncharacterized protein LOC108682092 [Hyalella azteca]
MSSLIQVEPACCPAPTVLHNSSGLRSPEHNFDTSAGVPRNQSIWTSLPITYILTAIVATNSSGRSPDFLGRRPLTEYSSNSSTSQLKLLNATSEPSSIDWKRPSENPTTDERSFHWLHVVKTVIWVLVLLYISVVIGKIAILAMVTAVECRRIAPNPANKLEGMPPVTPVNFLISGENDGKMQQWGPGDWMRPLGGVEMMFAIGGWLRSLNTVQAVYVTSEKPLTRQLVRQALDLLVLRIPVLSTCIDRRGTRFWYKRMAQTVIDFEVCDEDTAKVLFDVQASSYNLSTGPLWKVRMVRMRPDEESPRGVVDENQTMIAFGILHVITDATTNLIICKELVNIINDLLQNRPISSPSYTLSAPHAEPLVDSTKSYLLAYFWKRFFKVIVFDFNKKTTFKGLVPLPKNYAVETRVKKHVFPEDVTSNLIKKCKENSVTVHSFLVTVANVAYYDVARQRTKENVEEVNMYYTDCINLRRFYPQQEKEHIGCHITMYEQKATVSAAKMVDFWGTAKTIKEKLHQDIAQKTCLKVIPIIKWATIIFPFNIYRNRKRACNITDSHYITTNMGDVTELVGTSDAKDPVHISDIYRSVNGEQAGHLFTYTCHTFRKRLYVSIDYCGNKMTDTQATEFFNDMIQKITNLATNGTLK